MSYYNKYNRSNLINHIYSALPFDEFVKGNFSKAGEIVDQYKGLLQKCLNDAWEKKLGSQTIKEFIGAKLEKLLQEKEKLEGQKKIVVDKINTIKNINNIKLKLKNENAGDKRWKAIYKKFEEIAFTDESFDCEEFEEFIERLKRENPDNYKTGEDMIIRFLNSSNYQAIKNCGKVDKYVLRLLNSERNDITKKLSRKGNSMNVEKQIKDIKIGETERNLQDQIDDDVKKYFGKEKNKFGQEDPRSLKDIYIEILSSRIIINKNTNNKLRCELIKKYSDKIGLWNYIWDMYLDLVSKEREIRENLKIENDAAIELNEEMIKSIIEEIKGRVAFCRGHYPMWMDAIIQSDIDYLQIKLKGVKTKPRNLEKREDKKSRIIFDTLGDYLESSELEDKFGKIWDYSYYGIDFECKNMQKILIDLLKYMDKEDYDMIRKKFEDYKSFADIEKKAFDNKDIQLKLFF